MRKWSQTDKIAEENLSQKFYLVSIAKNKNPTIRVKMHQAFFIFTTILCFNPFNLKNKIMKIEQKKIFRGPSKISKNVSWSINICLKYFMASTKTLWAPSYIHNVRSLGSNCLKVTLLFYFFSHIFLLYTFGFHICIFRPLGWL